MQNAFPRHHYLICISATPHPFEFLFKLFTHSRRDPFPTAPIPARRTIYVRNNGVFVFLFRRRGPDSGCAQLFLINKTSIVVRRLTLEDYIISYIQHCASPIGLMNHLEHCISAERYRKERSLHLFVSGFRVA